MLVNATGEDTVTLWYYDSGLRSRRYDYFTWVFLEGRRQSLEEIEAQLSGQQFSAMWSERSTIYGVVEGLEVWGRPSRLAALSREVQRLFGGMVRTYNSSIHAPHRFAAERGLRFFHIEDLSGPEPELPACRVELRRDGREVVHLSVNGRRYGRPSLDALDDLLRSMEESLYLIYNDAVGLSYILTIVRERHGHPWFRLSGPSHYASYGRVSYRPPTISVPAMVCIPSDSFTFSVSGTVGIQTLSRISSLPPERVALSTPGTVVSSMEVSKALFSGILVPDVKDDHEWPKTVLQLYSSDRGGTVLQPEPGIYDDVYEIDFSSMYPSIIVRYNLSPETIRPTQGPSDLPYSVDNSRRGFLSRALEDLLDTRLYYKSIKSDGDVNSLRDTALKWLLLTSFGYTGYKNARFGKIEVHEMVTAIGRKLLARAAAIAMEEGFEVIHGIVDSLWLRGGGSIDRVLERVREETRLDIVLDSHYRWIVFLPSRDGTGALNRYFGLRTDGTYKVRGIAMRRSDMPAIVKEFQARCLSVLSECGSSREFPLYYSRLEEVKRRFMRELRAAPVEKLAVKVRPSRYPGEYSVKNMQRAVAEMVEGKHVAFEPGMEVPVVVSDMGRKVLRASAADQIDAAYYRHLIEMAWEPFSYIIRKKGPDLTAFFPALI